MVLRGYRINGTVQRRVYCVFGCLQVWGVGSNSILNPKTMWKALTS